MVYCLDKFADGPYNDVPYESRPFETIFLLPRIAKEHVRMDYGQYLSGGQRRCHICPGLSCGSCRGSPWMTMTPTPPSRWPCGTSGQISLDEVYFLDCGTGEPHPKSDRLRTAVLNLLRLAGNTLTVPRIPPARHHPQAQADAPMPGLTAVIRAPCPFIPALLTSYSRDARMKYGPSADGCSSDLLKYCQTLPDNPDYRHPVLRLWR